MHEFADEQATALKFVFNAPSTFGVGGTVHAADAADGARSSAAVANKTRRDGRSGICTATLRPDHALVKCHTAPRALDVRKRIAEDGHPVTARRSEDPLKAPLWTRSSAAWKAVRGADHDGTACLIRRRTTQVKYAGTPY
jgi:hypothetical protein